MNPTSDVGDIKALKSYGFTHYGHDLRVVCFSTALRRLNEQKWMLPCDLPSKSSIERWSRQVLKMPIGYVGYNNKLPYIWVSDHN